MVRIERLFTIHLEVGPFLLKSLQNSKGLNSLGAG
jgi:hypothetical protein